MKAAIQQLSGSYAAATRQQLGSYSALSFSRVELLVERRMGDEQIQKLKSHNKHGKRVCVKRFQESGFLRNDRGCRHFIWFYQIYYNDLSKI